MSYSTRRSGGFSQSGQQQNTVGNIGQRRPVVTNNFVSGGQLSSQKPAAQPQQPPQQQRPQQNTNIQFRNQQGQQPAAQRQTQQPQQNQQAQQNQPPPQAQPAQQAQQPQQQQVQQQQNQQQPQVPVQSEQAKMDTSNGDGSEAGDGSPKKKLFWSRQQGKVSKKEKIRRRNIRLSKMLQPKNAVMILNELIKNTSYAVEELPLKMEGNQFKASVSVESQEHVGYGRSKIHAKNSAAESALKHYVKTNKLGELKLKDEDGNEKMDVSEDDGTQVPMPWQHFASFALYKLFTSWGEDPNSLRSGGNVSPNGPINVAHPENKPAKKMPPNPETINPLMLINQMLPHAKFEEIGKSGDPPNVTFSFRCNVEGQSFIGTGPNKKAAKRLAAFGACHKILGIQYPADIYVPVY